MEVCQEVAELNKDCYKFINQMLKGIVFPNNVKFIDLEYDIK